MPDLNLADLIGLQQQQPGAEPNLASLLGFNQPAQVAAPVVAAEPDLTGLITSPSQLPATPATTASAPVVAPTTNSVPIQTSGPISFPSVAQGAGLKVTAPGVKQGVGVEAFSPNQYNLIQKGPQSALDKRLAADQAAVQAEYSPIGKEQQSASADAQQAVLDEAKIESQKIQATAAAKGQIAQANQDFLAKEQAAYNNAKAESAAGINNYRAALADYQASQVNPAQLWDSAGTAGQFAMLVTAFTHDFLGAKGIQSSGLDSIRTAIKQNIDAQLENMRKKLDVAQGFRAIWDMQRAQSATDGEARQRMNGFYLTALQNGIEGKLGSYDSQLALVKGQAAKAALEQEKVKNDLAVQQHIDQATAQKAQNEASIYATNMSAAVAKIHADAQITAASIAANAKDKPVSPIVGAIPDVSQSGKGEFVRRFNPDVPATDQVKMKTEWAKNVNTAERIQDLITLQHNIEAAPPDIGVSALKRMQSEEQRLAEQIRNTVKMGIIYDNSGKQINEQEVKLYDEIVAKKDWWTNGDNTRQLADLAASSLRKMKTVQDMVSVPIGPGDPLFGKRVGENTYAPGETAQFDVEKQKNGGAHGNTAAEETIKQIKAPHALEEPAVTGSVFGKALDAVGVSTGDPQQKQQDDHTLSDYANYLSKNPSNRLRPAPAEPPKAFAALEDLASQARAGDAQALAELQRLANGEEVIKANDAANRLIHSWAIWERSVNGLDVQPPAQQGTEANAGSSQ